MSSQLKVIKSLSLTDALLTETSVAEDPLPAWAVGTTYADGQRVSYAPTHKVYESLAGSNVGKDPVAEPLWWQEVSPTNRWKAFDLSTSTQTQVANNDYYEITPGQAINSVAFINLLNVLSVRVRLTDAYWGVVYDKTTNLTPATSSSWYSWLFDKRRPMTELTLADLPSYPQAVLRVDFTAAGPAFVGGIVFGSQRTIGIGVQKGARLGIQDYSRKERNEFGDVELVRRGFAKTLSISTLIENTHLDTTFEDLADFRSTPCLWICGDKYRSLTVFGFFQRFDLGIEYASHTECSIDIEGLV